MRTQSHSSSFQLTPLAACLAAVFVLSSPAAIANTVPVSNCNDSGAGSLRAAVAAAASDDIVNMATLSCSVITLTTGEILILQPHLMLQGPGADKLLIDGNHKSRVLHQLGTYVQINDLSIANGYVYDRSGLAAGGCIYSSNNVALVDTNVRGCLAATYYGVAKGGGVYAKNLLNMGNSTIRSSTASCYAGGAAVGGGAWVVNLDSSYSVIADNSVYCRPGGTATAGGLYEHASGTILNSTISNNSSSGDIGGMVVPPGPTQLLVRGSTISGNTAAGFFGGIVSSASATSLYNCTIAFNSAGLGSPSGSVYRAPGLHAANSYLLLASSLVANNTYGAADTENDFSSAGTTTLSPSSAHNLIRVATSPVPSGTITGTCPLLGPLRDNGGATQTHSLGSHSPAIDAGSNALLVPYDQRGSPFTRVSHGSADIGAYEVQQADIVFNAAFDGCP